MDGRKNIWLGLLALLFTTLAWSMFALLTAFFVYTELYVSGGIDSMSDSSDAAGGVLFILSILLAVVGLILAIVGILSRSENRLFPIISAAMSCALFVVIAILFLLGTYEGILAV